MVKRIRRNSRRISKRMSRKRMSKRMSRRMSKRMSRRMSRRISRRSTKYSRKRKRTNRNKRGKNIKRKNYLKGGSASSLSASSLSRRPDGEQILLKLVQDFPALPPESVREVWEKHIAAGHGRREMLTDRFPQLGNVGRYDSFYDGWGDREKEKMVELLERNNLNTITLKLELEKMEAWNVGNLKLLFLGEGPEWEPIDTKINELHLTLEEKGKFMKMLVFLSEEQRTEAAEKQVLETELELAEMRQGLKLQAKAKANAAAKAAAKAKAAHLFELLDKGGSGSLEFTEFQRAVRLEGKITPEHMSGAALRNLFHEAAKAAEAGRSSRSSTNIADLLTRLNISENFNGPLRVLGATYKRDLDDMILEDYDQIGMEEEDREKLFKDGVKRPEQASAIIDQFRESRDVRA